MGDTLDKNKCCEHRERSDLTSFSMLANIDTKMYYLKHGFYLYI